ncbi:MAG: hypothetical protein RIS37_856, partial [Actinomycetota bacterium]
MTRCADAVENVYDANTPQDLF